MPRTRRKNWSIVFLSRTWRCRTMRNIRSLLGTVRRPSINAQTLELFLSTKNRTQKVFQHETSPQRNFILRPTAAGALHTRLRRSKHLQIPRLPTQIRPRVVFVMYLSPAKGSPLARMPQVPGRFWTKARARSRSTEKTSRSRSSRCASC